MQTSDRHAAGHTPSVSLREPPSPAKLGKESRIGILFSFLTLLACAAPASAGEHARVCRHLPCSRHLVPREPPHISDEFHLTQAVPGQGGALAAPLNLPREITQRLWRCLGAAAEKTDDDREITLRIAFQRDGNVLGVPRVTYVKAAGADGPAALRAAMARALRAAAVYAFARFGYSRAHLQHPLHSAER